MRRLVDNMFYNLIDFILALILFAITFPLCLLVGLLIKIDISSGPIFYKQKRYGKDKEIFWIYKFRTMEPGAENGKPIWSKKNDPRSSKIGRFLRVSHIDEFPQIFNILKGEMSLVGPRPERPYFAEKFKHSIANYEERYKIKPGITGWSQINGWRGSSSIKKRTECDRFYIRNRSLFFNLKVLLLTPFAKPIVQSKVSVDKKDYVLTFSQSGEVLRKSKPLMVPAMKA